MHILKKVGKQICRQLLSFSLLTPSTILYWSIGYVEKVAKRPEKKRCKAEEKVDLPGRGDVKDFIVL